MESSELLRNLQVASSCRSSFRSYLIEIFKDITPQASKSTAERRLELIGFHDFADFPMLFSEKLFSAFDADKSGELNQESFVNGMEALLGAASTDEFTQLLFRVLDFQGRRLAVIYNIKVLLIQLHLRYAANADTALLMKIFNKCFEENHSSSVTFHFFITKLFDNADVLYLFLAFIHKQFSEVKESAQYYANVIAKTASTYTSPKESPEEHSQSQFSYAAPTKKLLRYLKEELNIELFPTQSRDSDLEDTSCDELSQLDYFESEITSCMDVKGVESPFKTTMRSITNSELKYKSMNMIPLLSLEKSPNVNRDTKSNKISKHHSSSSAWGLSIHLLNNKCNSSMNNSLIASAEMNSKPKAALPQEFFCTFFGHDSSEGIKVKAVFISNSLFLFRFNEQFGSFGYERMIVLRKSYIESTQEMSNEQWKLTISSDYGGYVKTSRVYFNEKRQCDLFYEEYLLLTQWRNIKDDVLILNEINSGNCGSIFTGFSHQLNQKVCIKKICKRDKSNAELKLIRWEKDVTRLLMKLRHKNIMQAYDIYEDEVNVYLVLEYIDGLSLLFYSYTSEADKASVIQQVVEAVRFLHKHHIIHRDIKHDNIMIKSSTSSSSLVKIVDFGFSRVLSKFDTAEEYCGSISFTAPEIILNNPYDCSVDIWSLGVLVYWISYKVMPFRAVNNDQNQVAKKIVKGGLQDALTGCFGDRILLMCLKTEAKDRSSLKEMLTAF